MSPWGGESRARPAAADIGAVARSALQRQVNRHEQQKRRGPAECDDRDDERPGEACRRYEPSGPHDEAAEGAITERSPTKRMRGETSRPERVGSSSCRSSNRSVRTTSRPGPRVRSERVRVRTDHETDGRRNGAQVRRDHANLRAKRPRQRRADGGSRRKTTSRPRIFNLMTMNSDEVGRTASGPMTKRRG
jgi:hypothetical protein